MSKLTKFRISASVVLASATVALIVANRPEYHRPEPTSTDTTSIVFNTTQRADGPDYDAMGTFATEKLKVTGTGSDSIVASGGMQMAGSASIANGSTSYGVTITSSTNHAGNALALKAVDNTQDGASVRFLRSDNTIRWSMGNNSSVGSVTHDFWLFDNTNVAYALYLNPATTSYLRFGTTNGRVSYDDTTHNLTLLTSGATRLTLADSLITSAVALDMGTHLINNVVDPVSAQDAATKNYVDTHGGFISGLTTNTIPKAASATSLTDSQITDTGTVVAIGGTDLAIDTTANTLDWRGGFISFLSNGSITLGYNAGLPTTRFAIDASTGDVTMNNGTLAVAAGNVSVGSGNVLLTPAGTGAFLSTLTADGGLRVFDVAGAGLTSSTNSVAVGAAVGGGITVNADDIQMTFCAANQVPQMNAGGTAWGCAAASSGTVTGSGTANTMTKFTSGTVIGNSTVTDDGTTVAVNSNKFTVAVSTGNTLVAGTLDVTSNLAVNTNKFTVNGVSGDSAVAGALTVASTFSVNSTRFTVNATTGDTTALGTLTADGGLRVFDVAGAGMTSSTNTVNVVALAAGGLTANADSLQMTFCAANQVPTMNGAGTSWGCGTPASGTITGSLTSPGVTYASGASAISTDATNFTYYAAESTLNVGAQAVTSCGGGACDAGAAISSSVAGGSSMITWNTSTSGYGAIVFDNSSSAYQSSIGFANSAVAITAFRSLNFFASGSADWIFGETTGGTVIARVGMTSGSASMQWANGSSAAASAASTGKFIYNNTTKTFRVSLDTGAYTDVITGAVTASYIPKSASSTTGALTVSNVKDDGTNWTLNTTAGGSTAKVTIVEASGNATFAGTMDVTGDFKVNTNKFTVTASSGNTLAAGTLDVTGNFAVNTSKFTANATSGDVVGDGVASFKFVTGKASAAPTASSCGTGPSVDAASTNIAGRFVTGASGNDCTLTFNGTASVKPVCIIFQDATGTRGAYFVATTTTTTMASNSGGNLTGGGAYSYFCFGGRTSGP